MSSVLDLGGHRALSTVFSAKALMRALLGTPAAAASAAWRKFVQFLFVKSAAFLLTSLSLSLSLSLSVVVVCFVELALTDCNE